MNEHTPSTTPEMLAALADGELDLRNCPDAIAKLAADPQGAQRIAFQQQLCRSVASAMDGPSMRCPDALRAQVMQLVDRESPAATPTNAAAASPAPAPRPAPTPRQSPVLAQIGRWAPTAVAAVMLIAATAVFFSTSRPGMPGSAASPVLDVSTVQMFANRHMACAGDPDDQLHNNERFGKDIQQLPGKISDYFHHRVDGVSLDLSTIRYDYQLAGACSIPGSGGVHLVYRHHDSPDRAMSLWIVPADPALADDMQQGRVYVETADGLDHPVILWVDQGLMFYLVGDSLEDVQHAVETLRPAA
ncbi:MAG: hypothetical protein ACIAXF_11070 [Phycisphaerales bacterium JB063]